MIRFALAALLLSLTIAWLSLPTPPQHSLGVAGDGLKPIVVYGDPPTFVSAHGRRIVAVGDLHGDLAQARSALEMAGVLSSGGQDLWTGGETVLVQIGDILDRGKDEIAILSLFRSLEMQANASGGAVFQMHGNHETMNVEGDFSFVDNGGFDEFSDFLEYLNECGHDWEEAFVSWVGLSNRSRDQKIPKSSSDPWSLAKQQQGVIARSTLLSPGGALARELSRHSVVLQIDDWVFCHAGLLPHHVSYGIERMNREVSKWMRGPTEADDSPQIPLTVTMAYDSVVWNRLYSRDSSDLNEFQISQIRSLLQQTLQSLNAKAMVVGHTPQANGANCKYNCSIWHIDVGMSNGVLNSRPEVLEIIDGHASVIRGKSDRHIRVVDT